jgi:hypothetical protein
MAQPGGPPLWILMSLNHCPACEELECDAAWVQAMRRSAHFAVFVYDEDPAFGNAIVSNFSTFPFLVRFRWEAGQIRSDVLTDLAAIRRLPRNSGQWPVVSGQEDREGARSSLTTDNRSPTTNAGPAAGTKER